jgi:DHA1 family multidrug resistance protein-like MFS transporter
MTRTEQTPYPAPSPPASRFWKRNLAVLWFGELIAISGFSVFMPFLPFYVQDLGISGLEQIAFWSGLLLTAQGVTMAIIAPVWGSLADRYGRKIMVARAMFGGAVIIASMGFVGNVYQLVVLRAIQGLLTGTVPAATTLVASSTPPERRGFAIGLLQMAIYLEGSVGPLIGGLIADSMGYRPTFWVTGALLFAAGILVSTLVREEFVPPKHPPGEKRPHLLEGLGLVLRTRALMIVCGIRVLMRMAVRVVDPALPLFVQQMSPPGTKVASLTGTISGIGSGASAIGAVLLGRLVDRIGPRRILITCSTIACVLYALQSLTQTPVQFLALRVLAGIAMGGILTSVSALQASLAPKGRYGAALTATFGLSAAFLGAAVVYGLATAVVAAVVPRGKEP